MKKLQLLLAFVMLGAMQSAVSMYIDAEHYLKNRGITISLGNITNNSPNDIRITLGQHGRTIATIPAGQTIDAQYTISNFDLTQHENDVRGSSKPILYIHGWNVVTENSPEAVGVLYSNLGFKNGFRLDADIAMWGIGTYAINDFMFQNEAKQSGFYSISITFGNTFGGSSITIAKHEPSAEELTALESIRQLMGYQ